MNKKIILSVGTIVLLTSSLIAFSPNCEMKTSKKEAILQGKSFNKGHGFVKMFMKLDLSDEQRVEVKKIVRNSFKDFRNPKDAFSQTSFDKKIFINLAKQVRDAKIERKAQMIEEIYSLLNDSQKKAFKDMLDKRESKRMRMKNC